MLCHVSCVEKPSHAQRVIKCHKPLANHHIVSITSRKNCKWAFVFLIRMAVKFLLKRSAETLAFDRNLLGKADIWSLWPPWCRTADGHGICVSKSSGHVCHRRGQQLARSISPVDLAWNLALGPSKFACEHVAICCNQKKTSKRLAFKMQSSLQNLKTHLHATVVLRIEPNESRNVLLVLHWFQMHSWKTQPARPHRPVTKRLHLEQ